MIDLDKIAREALEITKKRQENGATINASTIGMIKHAATEVAEAAVAFASCKLEFCDWSELAGELADVMMCCLIVCAQKGFNAEYALIDCLEKNRLRAEGKGDKK